MGGGEDTKMMSSTYLYIGLRSLHGTPHGFRMDRDDGARRRGTSQDKNVRNQADELMLHTLEPSKYDSPLGSKARGEANISCPRNCLSH